MVEEDDQRKLTAILSANVAGYSLLIRNDEAATVRTIATYRKALTQLTQQYRGRLVDSSGDNILAEFPSVVSAIQCALEIQSEDAIFGDGVNIAVRMEGLTDVEGICISEDSY